MALAITIGVGVLIVGCALLGVVRDLPRGILVFAGVLFGAVLVTFWAEPIASDLARRLTNSDEAQIQRVVSIGLFATASLVLGIGSGLLMPSIRGSTAATRAVSGVLGAFTGSIAAGFLLTYLSFENGDFLGHIRLSAVGNWLYAQLPLVLAGGATVVALAIIAVAIGRLFGSRKAPASAAAISSATPTASPTTDQRTQAQAVSDKIDNRIKTKM